MSTLSLCMIVRDAAEFLPGCLESVRGLAQEIIIGDTGSTDNSVEIAQRFGARVMAVRWTDDFSAARNRVIAEAHSEWILSLDADEQLDPTAGPALATLLGNKHAAAFQVTIRNYVLGMNERVWDQAPKANDTLLASAAAYPAFVEHENARLFRRDPRLFFVGRVHESVGPRIRELQLPLVKANFVIHHFGLALGEAAKLRKNTVYREMGRRKIEEAPNDWQAHFELGLLELEQFKDAVAAQKLFARACELNPAFGVSWFFLGLTLFRMSYFEDALKCLRQADHCGHRTALVAETRGDAYYNLGEFEEARASYEGALKREEGNPATIAKLGLAMVRAKRVEKGLARLRNALAVTPAAAELHEGLILSLVFLDQIEAAAEAADRKLQSVDNLLVGDFLRAASLWAQVGNWTKAGLALEKGLQVHRGSSELNRAVGEVLLASGGMVMPAR